jgi:hypothetical protein
MLQQLNLISKAKETFYLPGAIWESSSFFLLSFSTTFMVIFTAQGPEDVVAEYYQQQVEMLEGFNEMDTLTDRGFLPGMSKVRSINLVLLRQKDSKPESSNRWNSSGFICT